MKKSLAILLSIAMVLSFAAAFFAFSLSSGAAEESHLPDVNALMTTKATAVYVFLAGNSETGSSAETAATKASLTLTASNPTLDLTTKSGTGTMAFDAATGVLTLTNVTGVGHVEVWDGSLTVKLVGENVFDNTGKNRGLYSKNDSIIVTADEPAAGAKNSLTLKSSYSIFAKEHVLIYGSAVVDIQGGQIGIQVKNADTEKKPVQATIAGKANVTISTPGGNAVQLDSTETKFAVLDQATVKATSKGVTLYLNNSKTSNTTVLTSSGTSSFTRTEGTGSALSMNSGADGTKNVLIVKNGSYTFKSVTTCDPAAGKSTNATINIGNTSKMYGTTQVTVEDAELNVIAEGNNTSAAYTKSVALRLSGDAANENFFKVLGESTVTTSTVPTKAGAGATNLYGTLLENVPMTIEKDSIYESYTSAATAEAMGIKLTGCTLTAATELKIKAGADQASAADVTAYEGQAYVRYATEAAPPPPPPPPVLSGFIITFADDSKVALSETEKEVTAGEGKITFDAATATATLENVTGVKSIVSEDSVTIVLKGTNTLENNGSYNIKVEGTDNNLVIKGDGTLNAKAADKCIAVLGGSISIEDVTLNLEGADTMIFVEYDAACTKAQNITISGNAKISAKSSGKATIHNNTGTGWLYIKDNAEVVLVNSAAASWVGAVDTSNFEITGGLLDITVEGSAQQSIIAMAVSVQKAEMTGDAQAPAGKANFLGGKIVTKTTNNYTHDTNEGRGYGLFFKNVETINFAGTAIDITVRNATGKADSAKITNRAAISWQTDNSVKVAVNLSKSSIKIDADKNTAGILAGASGTAFKMTGGQISGKAATLFAGSSNFAIDGGAISFEAFGSIISAASTPKVTCTASIKEGAFDKQETKVVLGNPGTSAYFAAAFLVPALLSSGAAIVIRKKKTF